MWIQTNLLIAIAASKRIAFGVFMVSTILLAICLWRERDQCESYLTQESIWTPPVLVISSDDWGGVNPPETLEDLDRLSNALKSVTDAQGNSLVLTAYLNPAEPDFEKISASEYKCYSCRYCYRGKSQVAARLRELHKAGVVDIQFHGREHYNIPLWFSLLKEDHPGFREACCAGYIPWRKGPGWNEKADPRLPFLRQSFLDASSYPTKALPMEEQREMITSGLAMMEAELGARPMIFTPPGYAHDVNTLHAMNCASLPYIDLSRQTIPQIDAGRDLSTDRVRWGYGVEVARVRAIVRNVNFEPYRTTVSDEQYLRATMKAVRRQLLARRPLVISSHRWNYVEAINPNCERHTLLLHDLVRQIKNGKPDMVFLGASDLARHLYEEGIEAKRSMRLKSRQLSGAERIVHGLRCTWLGHARIRVASLLSVFSLLWFSSVLVLRKRPLSHLLCAKSQGD